MRVYFWISFVFIGMILPIAGCKSRTEEGQSTVKSNPLYNDPVKLTVRDYQEFLGFQRTDAMDFVYEKLGRPDKTLEDGSDPFIYHLYEPTGDRDFHPLIITESKGSRKIVAITLNRSGFGLIMGSGISDQRRLNPLYWTKQQIIEEFGPPSRDVSNWLTYEDREVNLLLQFRCHYQGEFPCQELRVNWFEQVK